jgi:bacterioferritin-associated ferredoxin
MSDNKKLTLEEIKARIRVVCICKGIKMSRICDAVQNGAKTVEEVNKATGSGNGGCGATRCRPVIEQIIKNGGRPLTSSLPSDSMDDDDPESAF